jgi:hypothetical protein
MERQLNPPIKLPKIINDNQNNEIIENICDIIYQKAYETYLYNILNDTNNKLCKNMFPLKLERSNNIIN